MDHDAANIGAQELDRETAKQGSTEITKHDDKPSEDISSILSVDRADTPVKDERVDLEKVQSEPTPDVVKIPRAQRRGLFGRFTIVAEVTEPKHYPRSTKWFITFVISMAAVAAPVGSTIIFRMLIIRNNNDKRLM